MAATTLAQPFGQVRPDTRLQRRGTSRILRTPLRAISLRSIARRLRNAIDGGRCVCGDSDARIHAGARDANLAHINVVSPTPLPGTDLSDRSDRGSRCKQCPRPIFSQSNALRPGRPAQSPARWRAYQREPGKSISTRREFPRIHGLAAAPLRRSAYPSISTAYSKNQPLRRHRGLGSHPENRHRRGRAVAGIESLYLDSIRLAARSPCRQKMATRSPADR